MSEWYKEAIFYHIYPLGFCGAPKENSSEKEVKDRIYKISKWIQPIKELGANAIYFGPLFESVSHGYDPIDYYQLDKRLGTNDMFKALCIQLHNEGIKIVLDGVFNHVGREFWAFKDLQKYGQDSKYKDWFQNIQFDKKSPYGDSFWYEGWEGYYNLVKLNLKNPQVVDYLLKAVDQWIELFDIDGLRLDVAYCLDQDFLRELKKHTTAKKEDFWLLGEMIHGDYAKLANPSLLHAVTNYECYKGIYSSHNDKNYFEINYSLNRLFGKEGLYKGLYLYNFVDNHDVNRIASQLKRKEDLFNVYTLLFSIPGIPSIYYESEWAIRGVKKNGSDDELRPEIDESLLECPKTKLTSHIQKLAKIRLSLQALCHGTYETVIIKNEQLVFKRVFNNQEVYIGLNIAQEAVTLSFKIQEKVGMYNVLGEKVYYQPIDGILTVSIQPFSSIILSV